MVIRSPFSLLALGRVVNIMKKCHFSLRDEFNRVFKGLSWKEARAVGLDTLKDLRKLKEIFVLAVAAVVPGGWLGYPLYRLRKYRQKHEPKPPSASLLEGIGVFLRGGR